MPSAEPRTILIKGSNVPNKVPALSSLELKELAINVADALLYVKKADETIASFLNSSKHPHVLNEALSSITTQHTSNISSGQFATVLNGTNNEVSSNHSSILGGSNNKITHQNCFTLGSNLSSHASNYTYVNNLSAAGDIECEHVVLRSPDGTRWKIHVSNNGHLTAIQA